MKLPHANSQPSPLPDGCVGIIQVTLFEGEQPGTIEVQTQITEMQGGWKRATTALISAVEQAYSKVLAGEKTALIVPPNGVPPQGRR